MIVKINGQFWYDTEHRNENGHEEVIVAKWGNPKLRTMAIGFWTASASLMAKDVHASSFYEQLQPLIYEFQSMALGLGVLAIIAGLALLAVRKRWGTVTLKTTAFIVVGFS